MLTWKDNFPVLVLHSPNNAVACVVHDRALASGPSSGCPAGINRSYPPPPSPPYTNPHLKCAIPLPLLDDTLAPKMIMDLDLDSNSTPNRTTENEASAHSFVVQRQPALLSPPYSPSPLKLNLKLSSVEEVNEDEQGKPPCLSDDDESSSLADSIEDWDMTDVVEDRLQPPRLRTLKDLDLEDDMHDWGGEPLIQDAPTVPKDSLKLNLFGGPSVVGEPSGCPSSPRVPSLTLPERFDDDLTLPHPDFDVLENDWDTSSSSLLSSHDVSLSSVPHDQYRSVDTFKYDGYLHSSPLDSPSRRSVVDLPGLDENDITDHSLIDTSGQEDSFERGRSLAFSPDGRTISALSSRYPSIPPDTPYSVPLHLDPLPCTLSGSLDLQNVAPLGLHVPENIPRNIQSYLDVLPRSFDEFRLISLWMEREEEELREKTKESDAEACIREIESRTPRTLDDCEYLNILLAERDKARSRRKSYGEKRRKIETLLKLKRENFQLVRALASMPVSECTATATSNSSDELEEEMEEEYEGTVVNKFISAVNRIQSTQKPRERKGPSSTDAREELIKRGREKKENNLKMVKQTINGLVAKKYLNRLPLRSGPFTGDRKIAVFKAALETRKRNYVPIPRSPLSNPPFDSSDLERDEEEEEEGNNMNDILDQEICFN